MIRPELNLKHNTYDTGVVGGAKLTNQLLMASCTGYLQEFPQLWDIKSRLDCYKKNNGEVNLLKVFCDSLQSVVNQIFILDGYFLKPEVPPTADEDKLISARVLAIKKMLKQAVLGSAGGLEIKILTDSPYSEDKEKSKKC